MSTQNIDWCESPCWARFAAMHKNGGWAWFEAKPRRREAAWMRYAQSRQLSIYPNPPPHPNWRESLQKRPEQVYAKGGEKA